MHSNSLFNSFEISKLSPEFTPSGASAIFTALAMVASPSPNSLAAGANRSL